MTVGKQSATDEPAVARPARDGARRALGRRGEQLAAEHLQRRGCIVLARNVRVGRGEIDLIVRDGDALAFVEVKTRRIAARAQAVRDEQHPLLGLGAAQRARLRRLAGAWLFEHGSSRPHAPTIRLDAVGVVIDSRGHLRHIEHLEGAF
ncbi:MAG TPA: YraN family protein [Solirubrobacteraceae bacterium]|jgi:putative endonuclease|nr:YraN family protein [Solirubrobacteraceae bacterium]